MHLKRFLFTVNIGLVVYGLSESYDEAGYGEQSTDILVKHRKLELMLSKVKCVSSYRSQYTSVISFCSS